ncbi:MAG: hypothetical protein NT015_04865 [Alphaproteobacteria bacterium]|nr:hypothetical protein [Alphaproteobacteria bacterium]
MSLIQALAIAAAAWVTVAAVDPSTINVLDESRTQAHDLAARAEVVASINFQQIKAGFCATPDGVRIERTAALR